MLAKGVGKADGKRDERGSLKNRPVAKGRETRWEGMGGWGLEEPPRVDDEEK